MPGSLSTLFEHYDYNDAPKQEAFAHLLHLSGAIAPDAAGSLCQDLHFNAEKERIFIEACQTFNNLNDFDVKKFLKDFLQDACFTEHDMHYWLVKVTQKLFFARSGERWETAPPAWIDGNEEVILHHLSTLKVGEEVLPEQKHYDIIGVLGASAKRMIPRIDFLKSLIEEGTITVGEKGIFLLTGQRNATTIVDGTEEELEAISKEFNIPRSSLMESHLMEYFYSEAVKDSATMAHIKCTIVDTPKGAKGERPTTITTLEKFLETSREEDSHPIESVLFISQAPFILSQKEDIFKTIEKQEKPIEIIDVSGEGCDLKNSGFKESKSIGYLLEPLGGRLHGAFERVSHEINEESMVALSDTSIAKRKQSLSFNATKQPSAPKSFVENVMSQRQFSPNNTSCLTK